MTDLNLPQMLTPVESIARDAGKLLHDAYHQPRHIDFKGTVTW